MSKDFPQPIVKAFLLCDQAIRGVDGKFTIVGCFSQVQAQEFPCFHARFGVFMKLGGLNGTYTITLEFLDPSHNVIAKAELRDLKHNGQLLDFETGINLPGLQLTEVGTIEVHLNVNGTLAHVDTLKVSQVVPRVIE